ncbi:hypothetical protein ACQ5SO_17260 [Rhodovulum sp. DZ06]|uniref:hypothetical protein n=1 Tax=Rhodovulum sp. DZ06 TaxID=3425126 RepID=UPI003D32FF6A
MTTTTVGALRVALSMDSAAFTSGVSKARGGLRTLGRAALAAQAAIAAAGAGFSAFAASSAEAAAQLKGFATLTNTTMAEFQRMAAAAQTFGVEQDKLADILKDVQDKLGDFLAGEGGELLDFFDLVAPKVGLTAEAFRGLSGAEALQLYVSSLEKANLSQQEMTFYMEAIASDAALLLPLLRNNGAELERIGAAATRYGSMTEAAAAAGREMREAQVQLGAAWTALGTAAAESGVVEGMAALTRAAADFIGLKLAPALRAMGEALRRALAPAAPLGQALAALSSNLDRLGTYALTAAGLLSGRLAVGLALAAARTLTLSSALVVLRGALIRTGIGALVVGAGELVFQFTRLVRGAGGFGEAMGLVGDVARGTLHGIGESADALVLRLHAVDLDLQANWARALRWMAEKWAEFVARIAPAFNAISETVGSGLQIDALGVAAWASSFDGAVVRAEQSAARLREGALAKLKGAWDEQTAAVAALMAAWRKGADASEDSADDAAASWENAVKRMQDAMKDLGGGAGGGDKAKGAKLDGVAPKTAPLPVPRGGIDDARDALDGLGKDMARVGKEGLRDLWGSLIRGGEGFKDVLARVAERLSGMFADRAFDGLAAALFGGEEDGEGAAGKPGGTGPSGLAGILDGAMGKLTEGLGGIFEGFGSKLSGETASIMSGLGSDLTGGLGDILGGLGSQLGDLLGGLGSSLSGLFSGIFGGAGGGGGLGSLLGSLAGAIPFFAGGTDFAPRGLAVVGERGPELVKFRGGESVIPNHEIGRAMAPQQLAAPKVDLQVVNVSDPTQVGAWMNRPGNARMLLNRLREEGGDL